MTRAIETTATLDEQGRLCPDAPLAPGTPRSVRLLVLYDDAEGEEPDERLWLQAAARNPAFDFLDHPGEDLYASTDGEPFPSR